MESGDTMKEKALAEASDTGKRVARRTKEFKKEGVKPVGCLKRNLGCHKTNHFFYNTAEGTVLCTFERKDGCVSPFPKKKPVEEKPKKEKSPPEKKEKKEKKEHKKKSRRAKKPKFSQMEFEVSKPPIDQPSEHHKKHKHHDKLHKHKHHHHGKPGGL